MHHDDAILRIEEDPSFLTKIHIDTMVTMALPNITSAQAMVGGPAAKANMM